MRSPPPRPAPVPPGTILGFESVGRDINDGQRYAFFDHLGAYAEYVSVPRDRLVPLRDDVRDEDALSVFQGITAQYLTDSVHPLCRGETALVTAAAGGVGRFLLAYAKAAGAHAIGESRLRKSSPRRSTSVAVDSVAKKAARRFWVHCTAYVLTWDATRVKWLFLNGGAAPYETRIQFRLHYEAATEKNGSEK